MGKTHNLLAFDLGASNGRTILGRYDGQKIELEEIHNFKNGGIHLNNGIFWDITGLFSEIKKGIGKAVKMTGGNISSMAVDSWGVDYGLLDAKGTLMSIPYHYRDSRTDGLMEEVFEIISKEEIYQETGIQFMQINTLFQLLAELKQRPWILENTSAILFIPDLVNYFLTGEKFNEYTIASTSQLYNPVCNSWSTMIFKKLGLPEEAMQEIVFPGTVIGGLLKGIRDECDIHSDLAVMSVGSHDTASAVAATPLLDENSVFLSSGTWSLLGMELDRPLINLNSLKENFTNEMGVGRRVRFLKNITGLWLIQECKRIWEREGKGLSYSDISKAANQAEAFKYRLDPDDPVFLNPENMPRTIRDYCQENNQTPPETIGEVARGIYESLAFSYKDVIEKIEKLLNKSVQNIHMVGGGIKAEILCQYTANISGRSVFAGPVEATAMGNIITQLIGSSEINSLEEGRTLVRNSIELKEYLPGSN